MPYKAVDGVVDALSALPARLPKAEAALMLPRSRGRSCRCSRSCGASRRSRGRRGSRRARARSAGAAAPRLRGDARAPRAHRRPSHRWCIVIDDLQWADADSLALLAEVLRPPEAPALLLVATIRTGSGGAAPSRLRASPRRCRCPRSATRGRPCRSGRTRGRSRSERLPSDVAEELAARLLELARPDGAAERRRDRRRSRRDTRSSSTSWSGTAPRPSWRNGTRLDDALCGAGPASRRAGARADGDPRRRRCAGPTRRPLHGRGARPAHVRHPGLDPARGAPRADERHARARPDRAVPRPPAQTVRKRLEHGRRVEHHRRIALAFETTREQRRGDARGPLARGRGRGARPSLHRHGGGRSGTGARVRPRGQALRASARGAAGGRRTAPARGEARRGAGERGARSPRREGVPGRRQRGEGGGGARAPAPRSRPAPSQRPLRRGGRGDSRPCSPPSR